MPPAKVLSKAQLLRLPPMLLGSIRWHRGLGSPLGDPCSGFRVVVDEHTASQFRMGPSGPEVIPGTGIWINTTPSAPCWSVPDEGDMHVVRYRVPDVHLNAFPDGKYRVAVELTGNWSETRLQLLLGYRRLEPLSWHVTLTKDQRLVSADFEVVLEPWRVR